MFSLTCVTLIGFAVQLVYAVGEPPEDKICFFRGLKNVVVLPADGAYLRVSCVPSSTYPPSRRAFTGIVPQWRRFGRVCICMNGRHKCSQLSSDTYDIYYGNKQKLIPQIQTAPADENSSTPWTLDDDRGDATIEDICDFIVEYINSDVMVCLLRVLVLLDFNFPAIHRASWRIGTSLLPINQRLVLFAYSLPRPYPQIGWCIRRAVHEARQAL